MWTLVYRVDKVCIRCTRGEATGWEVIQLEAAAKVELALRERLCSRGMFGKYLQREI